MNGWNSPRLGIHFELRDKELHLYHPDGRHFTSHEEETDERLAEKQRADTANKRAEEETKRAEKEANARLAADAEIARLTALLTQKGISLDEV